MNALIKTFSSLKTPRKIQDYLDKLPINFEKEGETYRSPLQVIKYKNAHCFEGACFALACLHFHRKKAWLLDLKTSNLKKDADHVVTIFKQNGLWGAISKTNHAVLRWRDPIYKSARELASSYFHEYFLDDGKKSLISYSLPYDPFKKFGESWVNEEKDLDKLAEALDKSRHIRFYPPVSKKFIRRASKLEIKAGNLEDWKNVLK